MAQPGIEHGGLESGLGHGVPLEAAQASVDLVRIEQSIRQRGRDQVLHEYVDSTVDVLRGVARPLHGDAFGPAGDSVAHDLDEEHVTSILGAEGRAEGTHERHVDAVQAHEIDRSHGLSSGVRT